MSGWSVTRQVSAIVVLIAALLCSVALADARTPKRVLLVFESEVYSPASIDLQQGILTQLRVSMGQDTQFFCEQLEATRFPEGRQQALLWVRSRYADRNIELVIFIGEDFEEVLRGVPTVYAGFSSVNIPKEFLRGDQVAIHFQTDFRRTIAAARQLQPQAKDVLIIAGAGFGDHDLLEQVRGQLQGSDLHIEYVADASVDDLVSRVSRLPRDYIVLPVSYTRDLNGNLYYTRDVAASLSKASKAPVYAIAEPTIGSGAVGGYVVDFVKTGTVIAGIAVEKLSGRGEVKILEPPEQTAEYIFDWRKLNELGLSEKNLPKGSIVRFKSPNIWEQYRWRIVGIFALLSLQLILIVGLLINRRHRRRAEASLRDMAGRLLEAQDDERRRIARDLHDGTGQHLSGMALTIGQVLADFPPGNERLRNLLQESHIASRQALEEVRTVSYVLHPPILDGLGLVPALRWYLEGLGKRTKLKIEFVAPAEIRHLSSEAERALFRIVQESTTNVLRHSGGTLIRVNLTQTAKDVALEIHDNGRGMNPGELSQAEGAATLGVGIAGMRERVRQIGGSFKIESGVSGTAVVVTVAADEEKYAEHSVGR